MLLWISSTDVIVQIENGIDEWATGVKSQIPFSAAEYRTVYQGHRKVLDEFEAFTKKHDLLEKICAKMYKVGRYVYCCIFRQDTIYFTRRRFHSGADPLTNMSSSAVSTNTFAAAMKEYEDGDMDVDDDDEEEEEEAGGKEGEQQGGVEEEQQDGVEGEQEGDVEGDQEDGLEGEQKGGAEGDEGGEEGEEEEQELEEEEEDE